MAATPLNVLAIMRKGPKHVSSAESSSLDMKLSEVETDPLSLHTVTALEALHPSELCLRTVQYNNTTASTLGRALHEDEAHLLLVEAALDIAETQLGLWRKVNAVIVGVFNRPQDVTQLPNRPVRLLEKLRVRMLRKVSPRKMMPFAAAICPDQRTRAALLAVGYPADSIHIVPPCITTTPSIGRFREGMPLRLLFRIEGEIGKGLHSLKEAVGHFEEAFGKGAVLLTISCPATNDQLKAAIPISGTQFLDSTKTSIRATLLDHDAVVFWPSQVEPFWEDHLAAMAAGLPVITTACGADGMLVRDGETGWIYDPNRPRQLGNRIARLINEPHLRIELGDAARAMIERQWAAIHRANRFATVLRRIAEKEC